MEEFCSHRILPRSFFNCFPRPLQKIFLCSGLLLICIKTFHLQNNSINTTFRSSVMSLQIILEKSVTTFAQLSFSKDAYSLDLVTLSPLLVCIIICLFDPPPNRWQSWRGGAKRQVTFQSLTPVPIQPWSMEDMIHLDFNIVLGTEGGVLVTNCALKSYTLKLEMATSIFINSLVHESRYIPNFRIDQ